MHKVAVFLPNWIGDVVMATPAFRALRQHWPDSKIIAICKPYVNGILSGNTWFDDVLFLDKKGNKEHRASAVIRKLRDEKITEGFLFPNSFRVAYIAMMSRIRYRTGYRRYCRGPLLTDKLEPNRSWRFGKITPSPIIDDYNRLVMKRGVPDPGYQMELFTTLEENQQANQIWKEFDLYRYPKVIGFNCGGAFGAAKLWPKEHCLTFIRDIANRGWAVVILCGPSERQAAQNLVNEIQLPHVVSLAEQKLSLGLTKAVTRKLDALVTTDSGPRHIGAAFGIPVVSLFGPTFIDWTKIFYSKEITLQKEVPCGPCQQRVCPLGHHRCMVELYPATVLENLDMLINHQEVNHAS